MTSATILEGDGSLALDIQDARGAHAGVLRWDRPPSLRRVAGVLLAHLGRSVASLSDLDIPGFYGSELRQHARQLLDSGDTRGEWLALFRTEPGGAPRVPTTVIATEPDALCSLCDDYGPRVAYHHSGGQVLRLHAACQAIWLEERAPADPEHRARQAGRCATLMTPRWRGPGGPDRIVGTSHPVQIARADAGAAAG